MPPIKPGLWSVNPADIDPSYLNLWHSLIACVPMLQRGRPVEVVRHHVASTVVNAEPNPTLTRYGWAIDHLRGNDSGLAWDAGLYGDVAGLNEGTAVGIIDITGGSDAGGAGMFGFFDSTGAGLGFYTSSDEVARFAFKGNDLAAGTSLQGAGPHLYVGRARDTTQTFEIYRPDGTLFASASQAVSGSMPSNGRLNVGCIFGSTISVNAQMAFGALWGRYLSDAEIRQLTADPFGMIRPAVQGLPSLPTASLFATGTGTTANLVDEADTTTNLHESIDDDPSSPNDSDWVNNVIDISGGDVTTFFDVTDLPEGFGTAQSAQVIVRYAGGGFGSQTINLYARLYRSDETTPLSNEVLVASVSGNAPFTNSSLVSLTGLDTSAGRTIWNAARVRYRWSAS